MYPKQKKERKNLRSRPAQKTSKEKVHWNLLLSKDLHSKAKRIELYSSGPPKLSNFEKAKKIGLIAIIFQMKSYFLYSIKKFWQCFGDIDKGNFWQLLRDGGSIMEAKVYSYIDVWNANILRKADGNAIKKVRKKGQEGGKVLIQKIQVKCSTYLNDILRQQKYGTPKLSSNTDYVICVCLLILICSNIIIYPLTLFFLVAFS